MQYVWVLLYEALSAFISDIYKILKNFKKLCSPTTFIAVSCIYYNSDVYKIYWF